PPPRGLPQVRGRESLREAMRRRSFLTAALGGMLGARLARAQEDELFSGAPAPDDPLELLYSRRLSFDEGEPLITVRVAEGRQQIALVPGGPLTALARNASGQMHTAVTAGEPGSWSLRLLEGAAGVGAAWVELEQLRYDDKPGMQKAREEWEARGVALRVATVGEAYGIAGHVVDTRRYALLAEGDATEAGARRQAQEIEARFGARVQIHREL